MDPSRYDDLLPDWLTDPSSCTVFMRTAFGSLIYWDGEDACFLDVTAADVTRIFDEMDWVFDGTLVRRPFLDDVMDRDYYLAEEKRLGKPDVDVARIPEGGLIVSEWIRDATLKEVVGTRAAPACPR